MLRYRDGRIVFRSVFFRSGMSPGCVTWDEPFSLRDTSSLIYICLIMFVIVFYVLVYIYIVYITFKLNRYIYIYIAYLYIYCFSKAYINPKQLREVG